MLVVLEDGEISELGSHKELLLKGAGEPEHPESAARPSEHFAAGPKPGRFELVIEIHGPARSQSR